MGGGDGRGMTCQPHRGTTAMGEKGMISQAIEVDLYVSDPADDGCRETTQVSGCVSDMKGLPWS